VLTASHRVKDPDFGAKMMLAGDENDEKSRERGRD
jgi:hypothetical protein